MALLRPKLPAGSRQTSPREGTSRWNWLRRYRIWEANRKVFVYPENYVEPEPADGELSNGVWPMVATV